MTVSMTSKTIVTVSDGADITVTIEAIGGYDDLCAMQSGVEVILRWLRNVHLSLVLGAIPMDIQDHIARAMGVREECASASASESAED